MSARNAEGEKPATEFSGPRGTVVGTWGETEHTPVVRVKLVLKRDQEVGAVRFRDRETPEVARYVAFAEPPRRMDEGETVVDTGVTEWGDQCRGVETSGRAVDGDADLDRGETEGFEARVSECQGRRIHDRGRSEDGRSNFIAGLEYRTKRMDETSDVWPRANDVELDHFAEFFGRADQITSDSRVITRSVVFRNDASLINRRGPTKKKTSAQLRIITGRKDRPVRVTTRTRLDVIVVECGHTEIRGHRTGTRRKKSRVSGEHSFNV